MGLGPWHMILLIGIILIFFGPSRLPGLGKSVGEAIRGFKKGLDGGEIDVTDTTRRDQINAKADQDPNAQGQTTKDKNNTHS